jgi:hypothetical protein
MEPGQLLSIVRHATTASTVVLPNYRNIPSLAQREEGKGGGRSCYGAQGVPPSRPSAALQVFPCAASRGRGYSAPAMYKFQTG